MKTLKSLLPGYTELSKEIPDPSRKKNGEAELTEKQKRSLNDIIDLLEELRNR